MNLDLFQSEDDVAERPINFIGMRNEDAIDRAIRRILTVLIAGHPVVLAFSAGKDSSTLVGVAFAAYIKLIAMGMPCPPCVLLHGDTLTEQPEISTLARTEIKKMERFALKHGIPLTTRISTPNLWTTFPVRVIGGRALPSFPDTNGDCSIEWKSKPNKRAQDAILAELGGMEKWQAPVLMTGVREDESIARDQKIEKRGEIAEGIWKNEFGALRLSPILDFTTDDVWEYIGLANAGVIETYSDFAETIRIYKDAGGSSCVIVADMKASGSSKPCGTRTGCWICTRVGEDRSMSQMIQSDPTRYSYLKPLAALRDFISRTQYDWSRRTFVGRTIDADGYITIAADAYSRQMLEDLLRFTLSAEVKSGVPIISLTQLIGIDSHWSRYAIAPPFTALKIYFEVMSGKLSMAPEVPRFPKTPVPRIGKIQVGSPTFNSAMQGNVSGLHNLGMEMFHESCGWPIKVLNDGTLVADVEPQKDDVPLESIDADGAADFMSFIAEDMIEQYCREDCSDWTWGYKTYLQYGTLIIMPGQSSKVHEILQRAQWRQEHNLHGQQDPEALEARCDVRFVKQLALI